MIQMIHPFPRSFLRNGLLVLALLPVVGAGLALGGCGEAKPSIEQSMASKPEDNIDPSKLNVKPRPEGLPKPTDAEFKAWDRKDPEGEKHLYKWDKSNIDRLLGYWEELQCFREEMKEAGEKAFGTEPGGAEQEEWAQFKRAFIQHLDGWQQRLFAKEPRIQEKSKFIGNFLEAHELVMNGYPKAYNDNDRDELDKVDVHWDIVETKVKKYTKNLGVEWVDFDPADPKQAEAHAKACEAALTPPDRSGKAKKGNKKVGPI